MGQSTYLVAKANGDQSMLIKQATPEDVEVVGLQDPRDMVRGTRPEPHVPAMQCHSSRYTVYRGTIDIGRGRIGRLNLWGDGRCRTKALKEPNAAPTSRSDVEHSGNAGSPTARESYGAGAIVGVRAEESSAHGEGWQVVVRRQRSRYARCELPKRRA